MYVCMYMCIYVCVCYRNCVLCPLYKIDQLHLWEKKETTQ